MRRSPTPVPMAFRRFRGSDRRHSCLHLRVRIANLAEKTSARVRADIGQQRVVAIELGFLRHVAARVVEIAEADRAARTRLLTRGHNFTVAQLTAALLLGLALGHLDALHTVAAL